MNDPINSMNTEFAQNMDPPTLTLMRTDSGSSQTWDQMLTFKSASGMSMDMADLLDLNEIFAGNHELLIVVDPLNSKQSG